MPTVAERIGAGRFVSFELWPPRSPESAAALEAALDGLAALNPAFVAITYGAGGSTRERTPDLAARLLGPPPPHPPPPGAPPGGGELVELRQRSRGGGVENLPALHGDPPLSATDELPEGD